MNLGSVADIASVASLAISIMTFLSVCVLQGVARNAVKRLKGEITRFHAVVDFSTALATMEEIKRLQREGAWRIVPDRYSSLKKHLVSIKDSSPDLLPQHKKTIQGVIQQVATLEERIEEALQSAELPQDLAKLNAVVSKQIDKVQAILVEQENSIGR